ncbi:hypothetical protein ACH5RR_032319 [Cinchona calisaya]|uniref:DUF4283 domain-containing protein n=1 Tax=Cinchona calisaya TaxID=153742 RepID=A0ABD2YHS0_9GENT
MYGDSQRIIEMGHNLYQFIFKDEEDLGEALNATPYILDNQLLVLKRWEFGVDLNHKGFKVGKLCVQMWNLLVHRITIEAGQKVGLVFNNVVDVIIPKAEARKEDI